MKNQTWIILGITALFLGAVDLTATNVSGPVSGTWTASDSPYNLMEEVIVPAGQTLTIQPGVEVISWGHFALTVNGFLEAIGTSGQPIKFTAIGSWRGIRFVAAPDSSHLTYSIIELSDNMSMSGFNGMGGGIYCCESNPVIAHCIIRNNSAVTGGGIGINACSPVIYDTEIKGNTTNPSGYGGGIYICDEVAGGPAPSPIISYCVIDSNSANYHGGGGIYCVHYSFPLISHCRITRNTAAAIPNFPGVGGIMISQQCRMTLENCTIALNNGGYGGLYLLECYPYIRNNIFFGNQGSYGCVRFGFKPFAQAFEYNDFYGNQLPNFAGILPPNFPQLGQIVGQNLNGDPCDPYANIYLDPQFEDLLVGDFHLNEDSPCINAGNPNSPLDPDGTIADIGAYYFDQSVPLGNILGSVSPPLSDLTVNLYMEGLYLSAATTEIDGSFSFSDLEPGEYTVELVVPPGYIAEENPINITVVDGQTSELHFDLARIFNYSLFATESMWIEEQAEVASGDVGVDSISLGPWLSEPQNELVIGIGAYLTSDVKILAHRIRVKQSAVIDGEVYYNTLTNNGTINGVQSTPLTLPVLGHAYLPEFPTFMGGTQDLEVEQNDSISLTEGSYGNLLVRMGATVTFLGGIYNFQSFDLGDNVNLLFLNPSEIRVKEKLDTDQSCYVGPALGATLTAKNVVFYIEGINGYNGTLGATPKAAQIGLNNDWQANIYVPNGTLWIRQNTQAEGSFVGRWIKLGLSTSVAYDGGFLQRMQTFSNSFSTPIGITWAIPEAVILFKNSPNPFNSSTTLHYDLPSPSQVVLKVYDTAGRLVTTLVDGFRQAGSHTVTFDGSGLASGVYLVSLKAGAFSAVEKVVLLH